MMTLPLSSPATQKESFPQDTEVRTEESTRSTLQAGDDAAGSVVWITFPPESTATQRDSEEHETEFSTP